MSTVMKTDNFAPKSSIIDVWVKSFPLSDPTLADPTNSVALVDGEWMKLDSTGAKIVRATTIGSVGNEATARSYPYWAEKGRMDVQASGERKGPLIWMHGWEADTRIFDAAVTVGTGSPITAIDQPVKVATITIGSRNYSGIVGSDSSDPGAFIVGYVTKLPANNGGKLRIRGGGFY